VERLDSLDLPAIMQLDPTGKSGSAKGQRGRLTNGALRSNPPTSLYTVKETKVVPG